SGIFTATEAAAIGALAALVVAILFTARNSSVRTFRVITSSVHEAVSISSMIFLLLIGGGIFAYMVALTRVPNSIAQWAGTAPVPALVILGLFLILMLPLGMFLDGLSIMLLVVP